MVVFEERGNRSTRRKPLGAEKRTNKLNPHMTPDLGIEPGLHWWEASALNTAPSLHPGSRSLWYMIIVDSVGSGKGFFICFFFFYAAIVK